MTLQVIRRCRSSLEREIFENVSIFLLGDRALNSRAQQSYNRCVVPRLSVMHGDSGAPPVYDKAELELLAGGAAAAAGGESEGAAATRNQVGPHIKYEGRSIPLDNAPKSHCTRFLQKYHFG